MPVETKTEFEAPENVGSDKRVLAAFGLAILYVLATDGLGFITATTLFIPISALVFGLRSWVWIIATTVVFVAVTSVLFRYVFYVILPPDLFFRL